MKQLICYLIFVFIITVMFTNASCSHMTDEQMRCYKLKFVAARGGKVTIPKECQ